MAEQKEPFQSVRWVKLKQEARFLLQIMALKNRHFFDHRLKRSFRLLVRCKRLLELARFPDFLEILAACKVIIKKQRF